MNTTKTRARLAVAAVSVASLAVTFLAGSQPRRALLISLVIFTVLTAVGYRMIGTSTVPLFAVPIAAGAIVALLARMLIGREAAV